MTDLRSPASGFLRSVRLFLALSGVVALVAGLVLLIWPAKSAVIVTGIFAELGKRLKQRAGSLSGGERQMVAMSRALMMDPSVLLLDEPSAGLSPVRQDDAFIRVSDINKAGVTTIMVEQNARRCLQICDRGYVLDQGKDAHEGTGRDLLNDPKVIGLYLGTLGTDAA